MGSRWLNAWGPAVAYLVLIFILSSLRFGNVRVQPFTHGDKILHALEYGLLCVLLFRALRHTRRRWLFRWAPLAALLLSAAYGATDEWHQGLVGRDMDFGDWLADVIGAAVVAAILMAYVELRHEPPPEQAAD